MNTQRDGQHRATGHDQLYMMHLNPATDCLHVMVKCFCACNLGVILIIEILEVFTTTTTTTV